MIPDDPPLPGNTAPGNTAPGNTAPGPPEPAAGLSDQGPRAALGRVRTEVAKAVVGQDAAVTGLLIALLCQGHVLLEGVPGVAKTLLVRALGARCRLDGKRVQFTPDLMPGDVTGSLVYDARTARVRVPARDRSSPTCCSPTRSTGRRRRPSRRCSRRWRSARSRSRASRAPLPDPFLVAATQNPVEYEGTYPLPEAQLDRFLLKLTLPLPERADEIAILERHARRLRPARPRRGRESAGRRPGRPGRRPGPRSREVHVAAEVTGYIVDLCRATRSSPSLRLGVSPRGATALLATSRAWAWLSGRDYVTPDDVKALARPTLRHRIQLRPEAELEGVDRRRRARTACWPPCPSRDDADAAGRALLALAGRSGGGRVRAPAARPCWP